MYKYMKINNNNDYYLKYCDRPKDSVYFTRYIGYNDELIKFLKKYYQLTLDKGAYIRNTPLPNPNEPTVRSFTSIIGQGKPINSIDKDIISSDISKYFNRLSNAQQKILTESLDTILNDMQHNGMNQNIIKNAYIKFMCWLKQYFLKPLQHIGKEDAPKILYEGEIGKYDLILLRILLGCGCDIVLFNTDSDSSYVKYDPNNHYSSPVFGDQVGPMFVHFTSESDLNLYNKKVEKTTFNINDTINHNPTANLNTVNTSNNFTTNTSFSSLKLCTNTWAQDINARNIFEFVLKTNSIRDSLCAAGTINNLFLLFDGVDDPDEYNNRLVSFKESMEKDNKPYVIVNNYIQNPLPEEVNKLERFTPTTKQEIISKLANEIKVSSDNELNFIIQSVFIEFLKNIEFDNALRMYNEGNKHLCWINRYLPDLYKKYDKKNIPCFIFFGTCNTPAMLFLNLLSKMPMDVLYINPKKDNDEKLWLEKNYKQISLMDSSSKFDYFPISMTRARVSTVAYSAEKELDNILYTNTGLYKKHQFLYQKPVTLKTTYEEISILWKEEAKYRPGFEEKNDENICIVPNIFAKICGVPNSDDDIFEYIKLVNSFVTDETIAVNQIPFLTKQEGYFGNLVRGFHNQRNELQIDLIKKHQSYKYDYLPDNIQDCILSKMQELIDLQWLETNDGNIVDIIIETLLRLDKETLRLIQQFDFTKKIPKAVFLTVDENMFNVRDCIYICFLNLIGFDILIFSPTGYRNIEKYVTSNIFETYTVGDYKYNIQPFELSSKQYTNNCSFFTNLFKRR